MAGSSWNPVVAVARIVLASSLLVWGSLSARAEDPKAMLPDAIKQAGVIHLATEAKWPPFTFIDADGTTMRGFEIDIIDAVAERLGVKVEPTSIDFAGLIPGVQSHRYDIAMLAISETAERRKTISYVDYAYATMSAFTMADNKMVSDDLASLCGQSVGVQSGTDFVDFLEGDFTKFCTTSGKQAPVKQEFSAGDAVLLSLYSGRVDFILSSAAMAGEIKTKGPRPIRIVGGKVFPKDIIGIIYPKENTQLGDALLAGLKAVYADGTYDKIMAKWDVEAMKLPAPGINLGAQTGN